METSPQISDTSIPPLKINPTSLIENRLNLLNSLGMLLQGSSALILIESLLQENTNPIDNIKLDASLVKINRAFAENFPLLLIKLNDDKTLEHINHIIKLSTELNSEIVKLTGISDGN